jgi:hypothetical protein
MKNVLMIIPSYKELQNTDTTTGLWLGVFTEPYYAFIDKGYIVHILFTISVVLLCSNLSTSQTLELGTLSSFEAYTGAGAVTNGAGNTFTGDVGTNNGIISGFGSPPAFTGTIHNNDALTTQARIDLLRIYIHLSDIFVTHPGSHAPAFGAAGVNGETIAPGVYSIAGAGSLGGALTLDGGGNPDAVFIIKFDGAFTVGVGSQIKLSNGTRAANVFWIAEGAISVGSSSVIKGTLLSHPGAITLGTNSNIEGRLLATEGAITVEAGGVAIAPVGPITIPIKCLGKCTPAPALDILGSIEKFALFSSDGAVANTATSGIVGDIGAHAGAISGFGTSTQVGSVHNANAITAQAKTDLESAYNQLILLPITVSGHLPAFGTGETVTAGVYYIAGAGSLSGTITLDGQNDPDAIFVFRFNGAFSVAAQSKVIFTNGTRRCNVFWVSEGAMDLGTFTFMKGTLLAHDGACSAGANSNVEGRMLSTAGAIGFSTGVIYNDALCFGEDTPISGGDQTVCTDGTTTQTLTATATSNTSNGVIVWYDAETAGTIIAPPTQVGIGSKTYYAASYNGTYYSDDRTAVTLTITSCNIPPIAMNDIAVLPVNTLAMANVLTNDIDPQGSLLTVTVIPVSQPLNGTVVLQPNGDYTYNPNTGYVGEDTFCYEIKNGFELKDTACVTLDIIPDPVNDNNQLIAVNDNDETPQDTPVIIVVKANDNDPDGDELGTPTPISPPTNGVAVYNPDGTVTYTPDSGFIGTDSFKYQLCEDQSSSSCDDATVTVIVKPTPLAGNQPPVAVDDAVLTKVNVPVSGTTTENDRGSDNLLSELVSSKITDPESGSVIHSQDGIFTYTPDSGFVGNDSYIYQICDPSGSCDTATVSIAVLSQETVVISPKVWLQGALFSMVGANTLMRDDLRSKGLIPLSSPYPIMGLLETIPTPATSLEVLNQATPASDAIVDWVYLELRDGTNPSNILKARSALLQRDGDIVEIDGVSPVTFNQVSAGNYYVAIKHRNHLGVMSALPVALSSSLSVVDFRNGNTAAFNLDDSNITNEPLVVVDQGFALWAGNTLFDKQVIYRGNSNDANPIYQTVLTDIGNILGSSFYKLKTYNKGDVNMDGETIFQGSGNDSQFIYQNIIINHPGNVLQQVFFTIGEQLPL